MFLVTYVTSNSSAVHLASTVVGAVQKSSHYVIQSLPHHTDWEGDMEVFVKKIQDAFSVGDYLEVLRLWHEEACDVFEDSDLNTDMEINVLHAVVDGDSQQIEWEELASLYQVAWSNLKAVGKV